MKTLDYRDILDILNLVAADKVGCNWRTYDESKATIVSLRHYWFKRQPKLKITAKVTSWSEPKWGPSTSKTEFVSVVLSLSRKRVTGASQLPESL